MTLFPSSHWWAAILLAASAPFIAYAQSKLAADLDPQSRARLPYLKKSDMDAKGQKIFDTLPGAGKDDILRGPLAFSAYNPAVAQALHDLHDAAVPGGTLDALRVNSRFWSPAAKPTTALNGTRMRPSVSRLESKPS